MTSKLEGVSVVIPSISQAVKTIESIPKGVETLVITTGNRSQARNRGARLVKATVIVSCDDDISFSEEFFWHHLQSKKDGEIIGLEDYDFGLLITRFTVISRSEFELVGGFDESLNHMEDTDICIRAKSTGFTLTKIPVDSVIHIEHDCRIGEMERRVFYLRMLKKHRFRFVILFVHMFRKKILLEDP